MDWIALFNKAIDYIEENLDGDISNQELSKITCCSAYNFQRVFSYIAGKPLSEYIRNRKLTLAAFDVLNTDDRLIDIAVKYGYESQDSFARAFKSFHGVLPSKVRSETIQLKSCPKLSLQLLGENYMNNRIEQLITHIYTADPSAHVFEGKLYIYPSHDKELDVPNDEGGEQYQMEDYHVLSMDDIGAPVINHGCALHMRDVPWVKGQMWAPDAAFKNGKYYLYFPAKDKQDIFRIGVAVSDKPEGPFKAEPDYIPGTYSIDPAVFLDDDGRAYLYVGGLWGGQLEKWASGEFNPDAPFQNPLNGYPADVPALCPMVAELSDDMLTLKNPLQKLEILDENGKPLLAGDMDRKYFEDPWLHKYGDKYYFSYSTGDTHYIVYAEGDNPMGPFTYKGRILEPVIGWTTHHSIVEFKGKWYLFYHDAALSGVNHQRNVMFRELDIEADGTINTMNPYDCENGGVIR